MASNDIPITAEEAEAIIALGSQGSTVGAIAEALSTTDGHVLNLLERVRREGLGKKVSRAKTRQRTLLLSVAGLLVCFLLGFFLRPIMLPPHGGSSDGGSGPSAQAGPPAMNTVDIMDPQSTPESSGSGGKVVSSGEDAETGPVQVTALKTLTNSGYIRTLAEPFTMGGKKQDFGFGCGEYDRGGTIIYDLGAKYKACTFEIGWNDMEGSSARDEDERPYDVKADGKVLVSGKAKFGALPRRIELDVSGVQALGFTLSGSVAVGNPVLKP